jgi:hypothetical protein
MTSRSLLIKVPSCPFSLDVLRPNRALAQMATGLQKAQHHTTILDYGTIEMMECLYPTHLHSDAIALHEELKEEHDTASFNALMQGWEFIGHSEAIRAHHLTIWKECAEQLASTSPVDFMAFSIDSHEKQAIVARIIPILRKRHPKLRIIGLGDFFIRNTSLLAAHAEHYDCIYWGHHTAPFVNLINALDQPKLWKKLPFLAFYDDVHFCLTHQESCMHETLLPDYSEDTYPALHTSRKLLYFDIVDCPQNGTPSVENTLEEIQSIQSVFNTQAFHFSGSDAQSLHAENLARAILDRNLNIRYTRECQIQSTPNSTISMLPASGCYAVDFQIDTGSQRLLDRYYRHPFTVTQVEKTIRACKFSNLFTVMNLAYPIIEDDLHTLAETIRLAERCKPHSSPVRIPAQIHKPLSDLKSRFEVEPNYRSNPELLVEHATLLDALQERGISTHITPPLALMANLAGYRGLEEEFMQQLMHQLLTGDFLSLNALIKQLNRSISKAPNTITFTPFTPLQHVVGN